MTSPVSAARITGVDLARALAMAGMVIVHYVWADDSGAFGDLLTQAMSGRAMPLFILLGGVGVSLAISRSPHPDRTLLIRAVLLFALGVACHETFEWIAVVLQSYGLLFAISPLLRRLPTWALVVLAAAIGVAGSWTYQVFAEFPPLSTAWSELSSPSHVFRSLVVTGYYPFFPVGAFFCAGMAIGRLDLRSTRVAGALAGGGLAVGLLAIGASRLLVSVFDVDTAAFDIARRNSDDHAFSWERLLDVSGHSEMLAWVISAGGTSIGVLGLSLLVAPRLANVLRPVIALGQLALTFYVFQGLLTNVVPNPNSTGFGQELATVAAIYIGFMIFAFVWRMRFRSGPLEAALRVGGGKRKARIVTQPYAPAGLQR